MDFLTKCSKLPLTRLWFIDRRMKGINLILNRNSDEQLKNVFWTWGMSTLSQCPVLGTAYTTGLQPCSDTCGPQDGAGLSGFTAKQAEMSWSSPHPCSQREHDCAGTAVLCDQRWPWGANSDRTTTNAGGTAKVLLLLRDWTMPYPSESKVKCPTRCQLLVLLSSPQKSRMFQFKLLV